jgi:hypothetical protein
MVAVVAAALLWIARDDGAGDVLVAEARFPAAIWPLGEGGLVYGERLTGRIQAVDSSGDLRTQPVAAVDVSTEGQRGLLGVVADSRDRIFAAWTRPDLRLVVGQVVPGETRLVWLGPKTTDLATGGHIAWAPDGRLVIGVGDLQEPDLVSDPDAPNGKLLALDPDGPEDQQPEVVSTGWNNPFAFAFTARRELWVADNSPGEQPERIARGDQDDPTITDLDRKVAPSGLVAVSASRLLMCGFVSRTLQAYEIESDGTVSPEGAPLATDCALGVVVLADGRVVYSNETEIRVLTTGR